jgi:hypothetical protein
MYNQLFISNIYLFTDQFMLALIEHSPDIYLDEIQEQLRDLHEVDVLVMTIWRMLKRLGIGPKKGMQFNSTHWIDNHNLSRSCRGLLLSDVQRHTVNLYWRLGENCPKTLCALMKVQSTFSQHIVKMAGHIKECVHESTAILFVGLSMVFTFSVQSREY